MDKLKMQSQNLVDANIDKIAALFPNCITEDRDENGTVRRVVDFDLLRQELSASLVEGPQERYTLSWPGKNEAILTANAPIAKTLRPCEEESVDFENTRNIYIEGDNLDALKLLQETYLNKVKMIYIDPPYNTGNDFIYEDDFAEDTEAFLQRSNQKDEEGNRLVANTEANGRFHSDWLTMVYPRLKLARNLLREDGVIFISIDDNEVHNLRKVCDEVFGETNFVALYVHKNNSSKNQAKLVSVSTEYFYCYSKNKEVLKQTEWRLRKKGVSDIANLFTKLKSQGLSLNEIENEVKEMYKRPKYAHLSRWNKVDENGVFVDADLSREGGSRNYTIINPHTNQPCIIPNRGWGKSEIELLKLQKDDLIWYGNDKTPPRMKEYINPLDVSVPDSFWYFDNSIDTRWIKSEFGGLIFENPKPLEMISNIIEMSTSSADIIVDFFSGSATTAHAVMQINSEDGGNRHFILVQIPEPCDEKSEAFKAGYQTIAEIGKERIRRAGNKIKEENGEKAKNLDIGFRVFKVDTSNMKDVYYTPDELKQGNLDMFKDHIKSDRSPEDLLFQVFVDWGLDLSLPIAKETIEGKTVFFVDTNALVACFDSGISEELVKKLAKHKPLRVVFRDDAFGSDSVKINVEQIFKMLSPGTEVKAI